MIYDRIKEICYEKGKSVSELEKEAGLGNGAISKWNKSSPTVANIQMVAKILEVNVERLIS